MAGPEEKIVVPGYAEDAEVLLEDGDFYEADADAVEDGADIEVLVEG